MGTASFVAPSILCCIIREHTKICRPYDRPEAAWNDDAILPGDPPSPTRRHFSDPRPYLHFDPGHCTSQNGVDGPSGRTGAPATGDLSPVASHLWRRRSHSHDASAHQCHLCMRKLTGCAANRWRMGFGISADSSRQRAFRVCTQLSALQCAPCSGRLWEGACTQLQPH